MGQKQEKENSNDCQLKNKSINNHNNTQQVQVNDQNQTLKKHGYTNVGLVNYSATKQNQKREEEKNVTDQLKYKSVDNQNDGQQEQERTLPIEGESQAKKADTHTINDQFKTESVHNQSDTLMKQQTQESKKYKHVNKQNREREKNVTDQLKYKSVDNQNNVQQEKEKTLPIQGGSQTKIVDIHP